MTGSARASKRVVLSGPLAEYAPGLAAKLGRRGFLPLSVEHQLRLLSTYLGTPTRSTPTGTCQPLRNCWPWPQRYRLRTSRRWRP